MNSTAKTKSRVWLDNLSIQAKASLAAALLFLCLLTLGANAYLTSARSASSLRALSDDLLTKQVALSEIGSAVVISHLKIFRHLSWASNGVSKSLVDGLYADIRSDLDAVTESIDALARVTDVSSVDGGEVANLGVKWSALYRQAVDTIDIGQVDPAMETMLMGQTDDMFKDVIAEVDRFSVEVGRHANTLRTSMLIDASRTKTLILVVTVVGLAISVFVIILIDRTMVVPILSITDRMQRLSAGDIKVPISHTDRRDEIGRMANAIEVFRNTIIDKQSVEQNLTDAIESISEGFSLYDKDDRLVVCNSHYEGLFNYGAGSVSPGTTFLSIITSAVERGAIIPTEGKDQWLKTRLHHHRHPTGPHIQHRSDGRWVRVSERLTSDGGVVATYTDITELKIREAELDRANAKVSALNAQLQNENLRMEGELAVSRRLQLMLLPSPDELNQVKGLDIAAYMEPAVEVGGDYYDVLQHDGRVRIGIGDVTGHGLESGVVMLMTQAIVRALLIAGETDPVQFLSVLNKTLFDNIRRMGSDKNLTLSLLDYDDGVVKLSGQHEHVIVVRNTGDVQIVDTQDLGFPVGLIDDIAEFVHETTLRLEKGDGFVLFSDGLTEAENSIKELYGLDRIAAVVQRNWENNANEIMQAVIVDLNAYIGSNTVYDDITILVAKQT